MIETLVLFVRCELRLMDRELLLGDTNARVRRGKIGEEELQETEVAELGVGARGSIKPRAQCGAPGRSDGKEASAAARFLAGLRGQSQCRQPGRFAIEQRVWEGPEVSQGGADMLLEVVWSRGSLSGKETEDEVRRG